MSKVLVDEANLTNIANAIRLKKGSIDTYKPSEMSTEILDLNINNTNMIDVYDCNIVEEITKKITVIPKITITSTATNLYHTFSGLGMVTNIDLSNVNFSNIQSMSYVFSDCDFLTSIDLSEKEFLYQSGIESYNIFENCSSLSNVIFPNSFKPNKFINCFKGCTSLINAPIIDLSLCSDINNMFYGCSSLVNIPLYNTLNISYSESSRAIGGFYNAFYGCDSLSDESLNNIMAMCISATGYTGCSSIGSTFSRTLSVLGLNASQATICQGLPNYQAFLNAGWTTGY